MLKEKEGIKIPTILESGDRKSKFELSLLWYYLSDVWIIIVDTICPPYCFIMPSNVSFVIN
jgi:hypothetical protein